MNNSFLDFERPIAEINDKIQALKDIVDESPELLPQIAKLTEEEKKITQKIYSRLSIWQIVQVARHPRRPHTADYISRIFSDFDELHGDRMFGDDSSIIGGIGNLGDDPVVVIGHEKGRILKKKLKETLGCLSPKDIERQNA